VQVQNVWIQLADAREAFEAIADKHAEAMKVNIFINSCLIFSI